jgi:hypothetical protein
MAVPMMQAGGTGELGAGSLGSVSEQPEESMPTSMPALSLEELARAQGAMPVQDPHELVADIWESDEELDAFLADLRATRGAS